jgi:hypothetical protein
LPIFFQAPVLVLGEWDEAVLPLYGFQRHEDVLDAVDTTPQRRRALPIPTVFLGAANETRRWSDGMPTDAYGCLWIPMDDGCDMM